MERQAAAATRDGRVDTDDALPTLAALTTRTLPEQVADSVVEAIAAGTLAPGTRLIEQTISASLNVSRVPVREAFRMLEAQGVAIATPRRGYRVAPYDEASVRQIHEVRFSLESIAARDAALAFRVDPARADGLEQIVAEMAKRVERDDWSGPNAIDIAFHREMCRTSGNPIVLTLWEAIARHIRIIFGLGADVIADPQFLFNEHRRLCDVLKAGDLDALAGELRRHLRPTHLRPNARTGDDKGTQA